jgi:hypothetical protein
MDIDGTSDPYAVVFVGEDESASQKTKVCNSDLNPVWDETLSLRGVLAGDTLTVKIYDSDMIGSDDVIGEVKISFAEVVASDGKSKWYKVQGDDAGEGEVEIGFDMTPKPRMSVGTDSRLGSRFVSSTSEGFNAGRVYASRTHGGGSADGSFSGYSYSGGYFAHDKRKAERMSQLAASDPKLALALENPSIEWVHYGLDDLTGSTSSIKQGLEVGAHTTNLLAATSRGGYGSSAVRFGSVAISKGKTSRFTPVKMQASKSPTFAVDFGGGGGVDGRRRSSLQIGVETEVVWTFEIDGINGACGVTDTASADAPRRCVVTLFHSASDGRCMVRAEIDGRRIEEVALSAKEKDAAAAATGGAITRAMGAAAKAKKGANDSDEESEETDSESEDEDKSHGGTKGRKARGTAAAAATAGAAATASTDGNISSGIVGTLLRALLGGGSTHAFRLPALSTSPDLVVTVEARMEGSLLSPLQHFYSYRLTIGGSPAYQAESGCDHTLTPHRASAGGTGKLPPSSLSLAGAKYQPLEERYSAAVKAVAELAKQAGDGESSQHNSGVPLQGASAAMLQALQNQVEIGDCEAMNARGPSLLDVQASAVWHAWRACGAMDRDEAMAGFIDEAHRVLLLARPP